MYTYVCVWLAERVNNPHTIRSQLELFFICRWMSDEEATIEPTVISSKTALGTTATHTCDYDDEILAYWRETEHRRLPNPHYMSQQTHIKPGMREMLIDWMVQIASQFKLKQETLFLSVHLLDRFLERRIVTCSKLQLVGCAALLTAIKYEENHLEGPPGVDRLLEASDKAYSREQLVAMEGIMLNALSFNLTVPSILNFLQSFACISSVEQGSPTWYLACYYAELSLQAYEFLRFSPSQLAGSALYLARGTIENETIEWNHAQSTRMGYDMKHFEPCIAALYDTIKHADDNDDDKMKCSAVKKKYSLADKQFVAKRTCRKPCLAEVVRTS